MKVQNHLKNPNYVVLAHYEEGSNTIRKVPENYCLIAFGQDGNPRFDVDGATVPFRRFVKEAYLRWELSGSNSKHRLAAYVSIALKSYRPFSSYPYWEASDVHNALHQMKQFMPNTEVRDISELEKRYRISRTRSGRQSAAKEQMLNRFRSSLMNMYRKFGCCMRRRFHPGIGILENNNSGHSAAV
jgi:hypothetical protein